MRYDFFCPKCKQIIERVCISDEIGNQKCECGELLKRYYSKMPEVYLGSGYYTRLSDIAPDKNASQEVKDKFKMMKRVKPTNPLKIKTKG